MFDVDNNWIYGKNKNWITRFELKRTKYSLPVVSGVTTNNGVNYYTDDVPKLEDIFKDSLTISTRGEYSGTVTYHKGKFLLANNILVMQMPKLTLNQKLFIGSLINNLSYGGYDGYPRKETLKEDKIQLPTKNGEIDFEFMESFVSQLEAQHIAKLEAYLKVTGLKDYELTKDEKLVLDELDNIEYKEFKLGDLFEVNTYKKRFDANKITVLENGKYPYVVRMSANNGQKGYILEDENYLNDGNTLSFGQDTATVFYQEKPYFTGDKIKILKCKLNSFFKNNALIFVTAISKAFSRFSWGSGSYSVGVISEQYIKLPIKNGEIDFEHMETLISAIQKLVIKDVILFSGKKIEATKKLIGKTNI